MDSQDVHKACRQGDVARLREVIRRNPECVNAIDSKLGWPPLYRAVICNQLSIAKELLSSGADPNVENRLGETPLHQAADSGLEELTRLLLASRADPNLRQKGERYIDGETPLHRAAEKGRLKVAEILLRAKADPNAANISVLPTQFGRTPLHLAVLSNQASVVTLLLEYGADQAVLDLSQRTALELLPTAEMKALFATVPAKSQDSDSEGSFTLPESPTLRASVIPSSFNVTPSATLTKAYSEPSKGLFGETDVTSSTAVAELNRTFSFGTDIRRSKLMSWLESYKLERLEINLYSAGIDSLEELLMQFKSQTPPTPFQLRTLGVTRPGHCARLLAAVEAEMGFAQPQREAKRQNFPALECCSRPIYVPGVSVFSSIQDWLSEMGLQQYQPLFESSGFDHLESVLSLMKTRYPVTDETLEYDIGIESAVDRRRILARLHEESIRADLFQPKSQSEDLLDLSEKAVACKICKVM